jgi:hypothetical protein
MARAIGVGLPMHSLAVGGTPAASSSAKAFATSSTLLPSRSIDHTIRMGELSPSPNAWSIRTKNQMHTRRRDALGVLVGLARPIEAEIVPPIL